MALINRDSIDQIYSAEQAREVDRIAIEEKGIAGIVLMKRAGRSALNLLMERWPGTKRLEIFCGKGNNAGDGYIVAGLAASRGIYAQVWETAAQELTGDAALARRFALNAGAELLPWEKYAPHSETDILVDALLGTGIAGVVREPIRTVIAQINSRPLPVFSLDLPSGLNANTGCVEDVAVQADLTLSFIALKAGLVMAEGVDYVGSLQLDDLDIDADILKRSDSVADVIGREKVALHFQPRCRSSHKGDFGHLLVLGGDEGFGGAVLMAAKAALRSGTGRVSVVTRPAHRAAILANCPELMVHTVEQPASLDILLGQANALVVGPGLGQSSWSRQLLYFALQKHKPCVLDADALNLLAQTPEWLDMLHSECLLTPHHGEAARMLGCTVAEIQENRFAALQQLTQRYAGTVVLKGPGSLVGSDEQKPAICNSGNPGMASAGMGDVLSGLLGGFLAQRFSADMAARCGVYIHAEAADRQVSANGEVGLLATDLIAQIRDVINEFSCRD